MVFGQDFTDGVKGKANFPPLDAYTTKDGHLVVQVTVAGYPPDEINVQLLPEGVLEISGTSKNSGERSENQYHIRELSPPGAAVRDVEVLQRCDGRAAPREVSSQTSTACSAVRAGATASSTKTMTIICSSAGRRPPQSKSDSNSRHPDSYRR